jgi:hypothetical protein
MTMTVTAAPSAHLAVAAPSSPWASFIAWVTSVPPLHLLGIIAMVVLLALGTVSVAVGLPILTGLVGLAIPTGGTP